MTLLIAGVLIWSLGHLFKCIMPEARTAIDVKVGEGPAKGIFTLVFVTAILLMIFGFIGAGPQPVYTPPSWGVHLNNTLMVIAMILMGVTRKGKLGTWFRHPMLTGAIIWSVAHLVANGDLRSIILFGGLGIWAILNALLINKREGAWDRPEGGPLSADTKAVVIGLIVFAIVAAIHYFIGPSPFGG